MLLNGEWRACLDSTFIQRETSKLGLVGPAGKANPASAAPVSSLLNKPAGDISGRKRSSSAIGISHTGDAFDESSHPDFSSFSLLEVLFVRHVCACCGTGLAENGIKKGERSGWEEQIWSPGQSNRSSSPSRPLYFALFKTPIFPPSLFALPLSFPHL